MYLISWDEEEARVEASLGGRVTADEMAVFAEELMEVVETMRDRPVMVVLDQSKTRGLDRDGTVALSGCKDALIGQGVEKVVTIARDETDMMAQTSERLQYVLEGREQFVLEAIAIVEPARWHHQGEERRAA